MRPNNDIRDELLSHLPPAADLAVYRKQVATTLEKNQKRIRLERFLATLFWVFCAVTAAMYIWFGNNSSQFPRAPFLACIFSVVGRCRDLEAPYPFRPSRVAEGNEAIAVTGVRIAIVPRAPDDGKHAVVAA